MLAGLTPQQFLMRATDVPSERTLLDVAPGMPAVPLLAKLYQESDLYAPGHVARVNPATATAHGIEDGTHVVLHTRCGTGRPLLRVDATVAPGLVRINAAPPPGGTGTAIRLCNDVALSGAEIRRA